MEWLVLALTSRTLDGPLAPSVALVSFVTSVVFTGGLGWWASRLTRVRQRRRIEELAEAEPVTGVH